MTYYYAKVLDNHQYEVPSTVLEEFSGWIHGHKDEYHAAHAPSDMTSWMINTMSTGNRGLVAQRKVELCWEDNMFFEMLQNVISPEDMRGFYTTSSHITQEGKGCGMIGMCDVAN